MEMDIIVTVVYLQPKVSPLLPDLIYQIIAYKRSFYNLLN